MQSTGMWPLEWPDPNNPAPLHLLEGPMPPGRSAPILAPRRAQAPLSPRHDARHRFPASFG